MTSYTDNEREAFAVSTGPFEYPEVGVRDSVVSSELGTEANPIVIGDDPAPLGSASTEGNMRGSPKPEGTQSNAIYPKNCSSPLDSAPKVIYEDCYDDTDQLSSDADTEVMTSPQFRAALVDESLPDPADECEAVATASICDSTSHDPEDLRIEELPTDHPQSDEKAPQTIDDSSLDLQGCDTLQTGRRENGAYASTGKLD
ncbi:hypothetical protein N7478_010630 [Penicillium angulare]|uniref:uncharacterized protein n=1 Tax=Penicillium angulare TaxID=116970 RepID=UPI0025400BD5|nr:uncharacterized protein N7478_010630 [Penicillium angulare]KAJ5267822.1 hypothetical protein N7478_010630 [Penicillium angulare]